jgi:hypothetical protein
MVRSHDAASAHAAPAHWTGWAGVLAGWLSIRTIPIASSGSRSRCRSSRGELGWRTEPVTLRWVLFHLTEETARHNGHIDILRELADGARGR